MSPQVTGRKGGVNVWVRRTCVSAALLGAVLVTRAPAEPPALPSIPRAPARVEEKAEALKAAAAARAERLRAGVERAHEQIEEQQTRMLARATGVDLEAIEAAQEARLEFVYFTRKSCAVCDEDLDRLVKAFIDAQPDLIAQVQYLGQPLDPSGQPFADALATWIVFQEDVIAKYSVLVKNPAFIEFMKEVGQVTDTSGRAPVGFDVAEAERLGIDRVPAFLFRLGDREQVVIGRPDSPETLTELMEAFLRG